jgi:hypothetical protein
MARIALIDALNLMKNSDAPFQIKWVKCNREKKEGGEILELTKALKCGARYNLKDNDMISLRQMDSSNHPHPIHIHLITEFNGQKIFF